MNTGDISSTWMGGGVLPFISLSCLRAGGGQVSAYLGRAKGLARSSSRPWA
ncbi:hypothetical protein Hanom_Chr14g01304841 [Helianthus anomalus]